MLATAVSVAVPASASALEAPASDAPDAASALTLDELEHRITELAAHLYAGSYRWLCLLREFDARGGWHGWGIHSCAHWLNWKCGLTMGAAREKLRVAHALASLPKVSEAFEHGRLSYSKVRALTRVAGADNEDYLLALALGGTASQLELLVRAYRRCKRVDENARAGRQHDRRRLSCWYDDDGSLVIEAWLPSEQGALVMKAIEAAMDQATDARWQARPAENVSAETSTTAEPIESFPQRRADALVEIVESYLATGPMALSGGERYELIVHVDQEVLTERAEGRCEMENGPWISAETARRFACDASVVRMLDDELGEPLSVGRKTRSIPTALRRALRARDRGCRFPGCTHQRFVDGHHIVHWAEGGETSLGNLVSLCRRHHRLVHEGGYTVRRLDDGAFAFTAPKRKPIWLAPPLPAGDVVVLRQENAALGLAIDATTCIPAWYGDRMDLADAVTCLYQCEERARRREERGSG
jgi:hypothetical protein